jgi:hypothetical protein
MKRLVKRPLQLVWRLTLPARRPLVRRLEDLIARATARPAPQVHVACEVSAETGVLMDHMVRELVRLQGQVEALRLTVEQLAPAPAALAVVSDFDGEEPITRSAAG